MKSSHYLLKLVSVMLCFTLLLSIAAGGAAADTRQGAADLSAVDAEAMTPEEPVYILAEDISKREESVKHFRMSDGSFTAAQYAYPIHYRASENQEWQDIDNTLTEAPASEKNSQAFSVTAGKSDIRIGKTARPQELFSMESDGFTVSWSYENPAATAAVPDERSRKRTDNNLTLSQEKAQMENLERTASTPEEKQKINEDRFLSLPNLTSRVTYPDIYPYVDLEGIVTPLGIKENFILKDKLAQNAFTAIYDIGTLTAVQADDKTIRLVNSEDKEIFTLTAPYMEDAAGESSAALTMTLQSQKNGTMTVLIAADKKWLLDETREYPVTVDPWFLTSQTSNYIESKYVMETGVYPLASGSMYAGWQSSMKKLASMIKMNTLPSMPQGALVTGAYLELIQIHYSGMSGYANQQINVYDATSSWSGGSGSPAVAGWSNVPSRNPNIRDYANTTYLDNGSTYRAYMWDITSTVKKWYSSELANNGLVLMANDINYQAYSQFASPVHSYHNTRPVFAISYRSFVGAEDYWSFSEHGAGVSGVGMVNNYTGNLVLSNHIFSNTGLMPASASLVYNSAIYDKYDIPTEGWPSGYSSVVKTGVGFKMDFDMPCVEIPGSSALYPNGYRYVITDGDGTLHYFKLADKNNENSAITDEDGLGLTLLRNQDVPTETKKGVIVKDKSGNQLGFVDGVIIVKIDSEGNYVRYSRAAIAGGWRVTGIRESAGNRITRLYYNSATGQVTSIVTAADTADAETYTFGYAGKHLVDIFYPDGTYTNFNYDGVGRLEKVRSSVGTGSCIVYTYRFPITQQGHPLFHQIAKVEEHNVLYPGPATRGNYTTFDYKPDNTTIIADNHGRSETWNFDSFGRVTGVLNADGSISNAAYAGSTGANGDTPNPKANKVSTVSSVNKYVYNRLLNHGAEKGMADWWANAWQATSYSATASATEKKLGNQSFKVTQNYHTPTKAYVGTWIPPACLTVNKTYTFSADMKIIGTTSGGAGAGLWAIPSNAGNDSGAYVFGPAYTTTNNEWKRISMQITVTGTTNATDLKVYAGLDCANGTVYFDNLQVEEGVVANEYNLIENGSFDHGTNGQVPTYWGGANLSSGDGRGSSGGNNFANINGVAAGRKYVYQSIPVKLSSTGLSFSVSLRANAHALPATMSTPVPGEMRRFGSEVQIIYTDGSSQWSGFHHFNTEVERWQSLSYIVTPSSQHQGKTIDSIYVYLQYLYTANQCWMDDVQINIDNGGQSYGYDSKGNVVSSVDLAKNGTSVTRNSNDEITSFVSPKGFATSYTYDANKVHRLTQSVTAAPDVTKNIGVPLTTLYNRTLTTNYTHDSYGNVTKTVVQGTGSALKTETSATYNGSGNYLHTVTDTRGNVTTTNHNTNTGLLSSSVTPNGTTTSYTYDSGSRMTSVSAGGAVNSYGYQNGQLKTITHTAGINNVIYNFLYDLWGNVTGTTIGDTTDPMAVIRSLITHTYQTGNGNLIRSDYGNSDYIQYEYDAYDRLTSKWYNGNTGQKYTYTYNNKGQLYKTTDPGNNLTTQYTYDLAGRPILDERSDGTHLTYVYDAHNYVEYKFIKTTGFHHSQQTFFVQGDVLRGTNFFKPNSAGAYERIGKYEYWHDELGRVSQVYHYATMNSKLYDGTAAAPWTGLTYRYQYVENQANNTQTSLVSQHDILVMNSSFPNSSILCFNYEYDNMGNISKISQGSTELVRYYYDALNQLVREDNAEQSKTVLYTYDNGGNILSKDEYAYTTASTVSGNFTTTGAYVYGDADWADLLTEYNGEEITYDTIGNPLEYYNGYTFTWQKGRQLANASNSVYTVSYKYNDSGIRTQKVVNNVATNYVLSGSTILSQKTGNDELVYYIDGTGRIGGFAYNGVSYFYMYNVQGDVIGLTDLNSNVVARYAYDSWGKPLSITDVNGNDISGNASHVANINPLRYRGYYWDAETGLFYVNSRYYDPETGRWINADIYAQTDYAVLEANTFTYCLNNPINMCDCTGTCPHNGLIAELYNPNCSGCNFAPYDPFSPVFASKKEKPNFKPNPNKRKGSENRQPTNERERNVGHQNGEEHSRVPKGNRGVKKFEFPKIELPDFNGIFDPLFDPYARNSFGNPVTGDNTLGGKIFLFIEKFVDDYSSDN